MPRACGGRRFSTRELECRCIQARSAGARCPISNRAPRARGQGLRTAAPDRCDGGTDPQLPQTGRRPASLIHRCAGCRRVRIDADRTVLEHTTGTPPLSTPRQLSATGAQLVGGRTGEAIKGSPRSGARGPAALDRHAQRSHGFQQGIGHESIGGREAHREKILGQRPGRR